MRAVPMAVWITEGLAVIAALGMRLELELRDHLVCCKGSRHA
jgi:hypothetical protein